MAEALKLRRSVLLLRSSDYPGGLESILATFDRKRAQYLFYSARTCMIEENKIDFLLGMREAMEEGLMLLINIDFKVSEEPKSEFPIPFSVENYLPAGVMNRDSQAIINLFSQAKLDPPELIHPDFCVVMLGSLRLDLGERNLGDKVLHKYQWVKKIARLVVRVLKEFKKPLPLYQTELLDESVNFGQIMAREKED